MKTFSVTPAPHLSGPKNFQHTEAALLCSTVLLSIAALIRFGMPAFLLILTVILGGVVAKIAAVIFFQKQWSRYIISDLGLLLLTALALPVSTSLAAALLAGGFVIFVGREISGEVGFHLLNPVALTMLVLGTGWITLNASDLSLASLRFFPDLLLNPYADFLGASSLAALLIAAIFFLTSQPGRLSTAFYFLAGIGASAYALKLPLRFFFREEILFIAVFILNDASMPAYLKARRPLAFAAGIISPMLQSNWAGCWPAIVLMSGLSVWAEMLIRPRKKGK